MFTIKVGETYKNRKDGNRVYKVEAKVGRLGTVCFLCVAEIGNPATVWVNENGVSKVGAQIFGPVRVNKVGYAVMAFSDGGLRTITSPIFDTQEAAIPHIKNAETDLIANVQYSEELADDEPVPVERGIYDAMLDVFRVPEPFPPLGAGVGAEVPLHRGAMHDAVRQNDH